jgi:hypothetical protein
MKEKLNMKICSFGMKRIHVICLQCDIPDSEKQVTREELDQISNQYQFSGWMETSAKEGIMVNESLRSLVTLMFSLMHIFVKFIYI